jgi:hypothetical protein
MIGDTSINLPRKSQGLGSLRGAWTSSSDIKGTSISAKVMEDLDDRAEVQVDWFFDSFGAHKTHRMPAGGCGSW